MVHNTGADHHTYPCTDTHLGLLPHSGGPVAAWADGGRVRIYDLTLGAENAAGVTGDAVLSAGGRLYVKQDGALLEIEFRAFPSGVQVGTRLAASVMPQATFAGNGVALQSIVGACYATLQDEGGRAPQVRLPELDGTQIVEAKYQGRVLMVTANKEGRTDKFIFRFDVAHGYDVRRVEDVPTGGVNFVVLASGVCLHLTDEGVLEVFSPRRGIEGLRTMTDPRLSADCRLLASGAQALFAQGRTLYRFSMKQNA